MTAPSGRNGASPLHHALPRAQALLEAALAERQRKILGIAAAPGAGKSTLAAALKEALGERVLVVPMDGYHLANSELKRLGRAQRKGAADTFDADGYANLIERIRKPHPNEVVYAPDFRRELEEGIAGAIPVHADIALVITEGNYLLRQESAWQRARAAMDDVWYFDVDDAIRRQRLLARHMRFGRSEADARAWMAQSDEPNAVQIAQTRVFADWVLHEHGE